MFQLLKNLRNSLLFKSDNKTMLGRWKINDSSVIKSIYANHDHCGDIICKNPEKISQFVKNEINNKKKIVKK